MRTSEDESAVTRTSPTISEDEDDDDDTVAAKQHNNRHEKPAIAKPTGPLVAERLFWLCFARDAFVQRARAGSLEGGRRTDNLLPAYYPS